nr:DUF72 domain-containing protein [Pseudomonas sp.]
MQNSLFPDDGPAPAGIKPSTAAAGGVMAADHPAELVELGQQLPLQVRLGGSTWSYPGWQGMVWGEQYTPSVLSRHGLSAYATHPLMRAVGIDRSFYRGLSAVEYAQYAGQVPADFRFVVKGPASVCDAVLRESEGRGTKHNPQFLNAEVATREFVLPAAEGLGEKLGVLCFQLSPLPLPLLVDMPLCLSLLEDMLQGLPDVRAIAPNALIAVEVRDPEWLRPEFADLLKRHGAAYCLGGHPKMPPIEAQLPVLRALWPGPLICRWLLNRVHGPFGQGKADKAYAPYDRFHHEDPHMRAELAKLAAVFAKAGQPVYITVSNTAEGSAPLSVQALAREIVQQTP